MANVATQQALYPTESKTTPTKGEATLSRGGDSTDLTPEAWETLSRCFAEAGPALMKERGEIC